MRGSARDIHIYAYTHHDVTDWYRNLRAERHNIIKALFVCKLAEGSSVNPHVIKMMGYIEALDKLGCELKNDLATDVILQSIPVSYELFIMNFHMNDMEKYAAELHGML
jgi:hypothetical protein